MISSAGITTSIGRCNSLESSKTWVGSSTADGACK